MQPLNPKFFSTLLGTKLNQPRARPNQEPNSNPSLIQPNHHQYPPQPTELAPGLEQLANAPATFRHLGTRLLGSRQHWERLPLGWRPETETVPTVLGTELCERWCCSSQPRLWSRAFGPWCNFRPHHLWRKSGPIDRFCTRSRHWIEIEWALLCCNCSSHFFPRLEPNRTLYCTWRLQQKNKVTNITRNHWNQVLLITYFLINYKSLTNLFTFKQFNGFPIQVN